MKKKFLVVLGFTFFICRAETQNEHLEKLKKEFSLGLITDDYGILDIQDLKRNAYHAEPYSFLKGEWGPYEIWQCFEVKNSKLVCEIGGRDDDTKEMMAMMVIFGTRSGETHDFISRRPMALKSCRLYQADWKKFTKNEKYLCVSGSTPLKRCSMESQGGTGFLEDTKHERVAILIFKGNVSPSSNVRFNPGLSCPIAQSDL